MTDDKELLILSLETTTRFGSVAVQRGGEVLAQKTNEEKSSQSNWLLSVIGELLQKCNLKLKEIDLLAVAVGPGSFTGLRIGLSTAKALASALAIPIVGVSTLEAAAASCKSEGIVWAALPAGRNEVFVQIFKHNFQKGTEPLSQIEICSVQELIEKVVKENHRKVLADEEIIFPVKEALRTDFDFEVLTRNLAVYVGFVARYAFETNKLHSYPPNPIYARGAGIGWSRNV